MTPGKTGNKAYNGLADQSIPPAMESLQHCYGQIRSKTPQGRARAGEDERPTGGTTETTGNETRTTRQEMDTSRVCSCGKTCKNERGLKIHRTKMGCSTTPNLVQRTGQRTEQPHETEEEMN